jgi:fumarylacetoacetase
MSGLKRSWIDAANSAKTPFPLNNLPYGRYMQSGLKTPCTAIGDQVLDLRALEKTGLLDIGRGDFFQHAGGINAFMSAGRKAWSDLRSTLSELLSEANTATRDQVGACLRPITDTQMAMPFDVSEFTDFYAGRHHATNVGTMFRGAEDALPPNWLHIPIGYNGRASSVVVSGTDVRRPWGQLKSPDHDLPAFLPSRRFDFELEMGAIVGTPSEGPISVTEADAALFGYVLLNDWSARDIQAWEYQPLGPFQAKATATTISPWIVTAAALDPFRVDTPPREFALLDHLKDAGPMLYDIDLDVTLAPKGAAPSTLTRTNYREMYYSAAQQLAHHTSSGCPMRTGDLLGSGTISGPEKSERGSLLELSWGGKEPLTLETGQTRTFLEDGDTLTLTGAARGDGYTIGFGSCSGAVLPALPNPYTA